uniref:MAP7 domain containing 2b n=1 Tax=Sinocyclocheilus anshuiensis TaxID=1608454 RepID=A0A671R4G2_9TELE
KREEKDRSKAGRERALLEKEQRAQQQYERSLVERGKRLEEQRQKEMLRRSAVEEKRRQRIEEEKERLEALMRRSMGRNLLADQRPKRWTWGGPPGVCEGECVCACEGVEGPLCELLSGPWGAGMDGEIGKQGVGTALQPFLSCLCSRIASSSPHRSPYRASPTRAERKKVKSPVTPTGKAGTTDAEEASRLLTERRRLARVQKEQEEKQRLEEERLRAEELQRQQEEERQRQEQAAREAEEKRQRQEEERCQRELEDRHQKEQRWKELQDEVVRQVRGILYYITLKTINYINCNTAIISPPKATSESPIICLVPLETKSCGADDLSDGVQSMDVSPVSRDELVPEYSPVSEISHNSMTSVALGDIHVLTGQFSHPKVSAAPAFGDCNKNLIQDCSSAAIDSSLFQSLRPTSDKLNI